MISIHHFEDGENEIDTAKVKDFCKVVLTEEECAYVGSKINRLFDMHASHGLDKGVLVNKP